MEKENYPIQYQNKNVHFYDTDLFVDERVLIPRPETELLCEKIITRQTTKENKIEILDVCTGSGAIAIILAKHIENSIAYGIDISEEALQVAKKNVQNNKLNHKVFLFQNNLLTGVKKHFDIIVSNPPYVLSNEMKNLPANVLFEPKIALDGGEDGLIYYKQIIKKAKQCLKPKGLLALEIHEQKAKQIKQLAKDSNFDTVEIMQDYTNRDRFIFISTNNSLNSWNS